MRSPGEWHPAVQERTSKTCPSSYSIPQCVGATYDNTLKHWGFPLGCTADFLCWATKRAQHSTSNLLGKCPVAVPHKPAGLKENPKWPSMRSRWCCAEALGPQGKYYTNKEGLILSPALPGEQHAQSSQIFYLCYSMSDVHTLTALSERPDCASSRGRTAQMHRRYQIMPTELTACAQVHNVGFNNMHRLGTLCIYFQYLKKTVFFQTILAWRCAKLETQTFKSKSASSN